jgi:hypothetical protein
VSTGAQSDSVKRAVLHLNGSPVDRDVIELGCKLARADRTELVAVYVVEVDWRHDLDDDLEVEREAASRALDLAEGLAERAKVRLDTQLLQARDVGAALVDEAVKVRFGGDFAIGLTIPYVFKNAPCRVFVIREPVAKSETREALSKRF